MGAAQNVGDTLALSVTGTREELLARQAAGCAYLARNRIRALRVAAAVLGPAGVGLIVTGSVPVGLPLVFFAVIVVVVTRRSRLERQFMASLRRAPFAGEPFTLTADPGSVTMVAASASSSWRWSNFAEVVEVDDGLFLVLGGKSGVLALPPTAFPTPEARARAQVLFTSWIRAAGQ